MYKMQAHSSNPIVAMKKILLKGDIIFIHIIIIKLKYIHTLKVLFSGLMQWYNWWKEILFKIENGNLVL